MYNIGKCSSSSTMNPFVEAVDRWQELGKDIPIQDVPYSILRRVSRYFVHDWKLFAAHLGIENIQTLDEIEGDAIAWRQWPSEVAVTYLAQNGTSTSSLNSATFCDLIALLAKKQCRLNALQKLYDSGEVEVFLRTRKQSNDVSNLQQKEYLKLFRGRENHEFLEKMVPHDRLSEVLRNITIKQFDHSPSKDQYTELMTANRQLDYTVNACRIIKEDKNVTDIAVIEPSIKAVIEPSVKVVVEPSIKAVVDVDVDVDRITRLTKPTILLTYSSDVENIVTELVDRFCKVDIVAVAEYLLRGRGVLEMNPVAALESIFKQCHFVVPILSNKYLLEISQTDIDADQASQNVRFIYDLYTGKYMSDGCRNHIVRPLVMSDIQPRLLRGVNPTLRMRWRLWEDVDALCRLIHDGFQARMRRKQM